MTKTANNTPKFTWIGTTGAFAIITFIAGGAYLFHAPQAGAETKKYVGEVTSAFTMGKQRNNTIITVAYQDENNIEKSTKVFFADRKKQEGDTVSIYTTNNVFGIAIPRDSPVEHTNETNSIILTIALASLLVTAAGAVVAWKKGEFASLKKLGS